MPFVTAPGLASAQRVGIPLAEFQRPLAYRLVSDNDATAGHQLLNVAKTQRKSEVQPHDMADDLDWITEAAVDIGFLHPTIL